jgi:hypothetical protein
MPMRGVGGLRLLSGTLRNAAEQPQATARGGAGGGALLFPTPLAAAPFALLAGSVRRQSGCHPAGQTGARDF